MPHQAAGFRIDPPVSVPSVPRQRPAATATAEPLDEPPEECATLHGFKAGPKSGCTTPYAHSSMLSLPSETAPAAVNACTTVASVSGTRRAWMREALVVRTPAVAMRSL